MQELDLHLVFTLLLAKIKWIIISVAAGVLLFASYAYFFVADTYTSSVLVYVRNVATGTQANSATASNLSASEYLANTYAVAIKTEPVLNEASAELRGVLTAKELSDSVSVSSVKETSFLKISVEHGDPQTAQLVCSTIAKVSATSFDEIGEVGSAKVVGDASKAVKTAPNVPRSAILGAILGLALSAFVIILREMLNNTVRDKTTLQTKFDVPVLGEIPSFDPAKQRRGRRD